MNLQKTELIIQVGEQRADFSAIDYSLLCAFCSEEFPLPLGACDMMGFFFIVAIPGPSI